MIEISNLVKKYGDHMAVDHLSLTVEPGKIYGLLGPNGAGKSTFLKILCGVLPPTTGEVTILKELRMSVLKQDHFAYDAYTVLDTVIMGNERLYAIMQEKDALYAKPDFSEEDGNHAAELEAEFAELNGWEAEKCLQFGWASGVLAASSLNDYAEPADEKQVWDIYKGNARVQR